MADLARLHLRDQILNCSSCPLHKDVDSPVPFAGPSPTRVAVMGEAPAELEQKECKPFVGPAGSRLQALMKGVGIDLASIFWLNSVSCMPFHEGRGRAPINNEIQACEKNRMDQLRLSGAEWVLLTGNIPLQVFRPDLRIGKARGRPFLLVRHGIQMKAFPVFHPSAVLRNPKWEPDLVSDLRAFKHILDMDPGTPLAEICWTTCVVCDEADEEWTFDEDGMVYCRNCIKKSPCHR